MPAVAQLEFPFGSLDFPGRTNLTIAEVASRLGVSDRHVVNLIESGQLNALNLGHKGKGRAWYRIPAESWRAFVLQHLTTEVDRSPILAISTPALLAHYRDVHKTLRLRGVTLHELSHV